jgi:hypothetical protein
MQVGNGKWTDIWGDACCMFVPLKSKFPELFGLCQEQRISVAIAHNSNWRFTFRRWLSAELQEQMRELSNILCTVILCTEQ